mmetsp:Transcript_264/g.442  ORF Transcript_264/g.442 Transcript_264/m.442 type:complete len:498 (-) Transcript_264:155-1648(-)
MTSSSTGRSVSANDFTADPSQYQSLPGGSGGMLPSGAETSVQATFHNNEEEPTPQRVRASFFLMALCFSLNHSSVTTVLALATTELGGKLGGYSSGTLYVTYTLCALLFATAIVQRLGQKGALVAGCTAYCFYVVAFLIAYLVDNPIVVWLSAIGGSVLGGMAAGWLWSANTAYLTTTVKVYIDARGSDDASERTPLLPDAGEEAPGARTERRERQNRETASTFSSIFSTTYLGCEMGTKLVSFAVLQFFGGRLLNLTLCSVLAVTSAAGMLFIVDVEACQARRSANTPGDGSRKTLLEGLLGAATLFATDIRMPLMYPLQMGFGFTSSFLVYYVTAKVVNQFFGEASISLLTALISGTGAVLSLPISWAVPRTGSALWITLGLGCFMLVNALFTLLPKSTFGTYLAIVPMYLVYGVGRCIFEGQNKAVMANFFPNHGAAWGANLIVASGGSSAIGFFLYPHLEKEQMALIGCIASALGLVCYLIAETVHRSTRLQP